MKPKIRIEPGQATTVDIHVIHLPRGVKNQRAPHRPKALEPHWPIGVYCFVPDRSLRRPRLASPTKQLQRSHSGTTGNRRNIGARNRRLLHRAPGLRLGRPAAPNPKRPRLQMLDHVTISIFRHRRIYRNFLQISGFINAGDSQTSINRAMCGLLGAYRRSGRDKKRGAISRSATITMAVDDDRRGPSAKRMKWVEDFDLEPQAPDYGSSWMPVPSEPPQ
jgi:hypothetical protein